MAPIEDPELLPISVGRQIRGHQTDQPKGYDDPAVGTILAHTRAQISAAENGNGRRHEKCDREGNQGRVGEEGGKTSPAEDGETEIGEGPCDGDEHQPGCGHDGYQALTISLHMR
jgi:hypothetical protein